MKQVTGSNTPQATNKVSIQLTLDGHSFSAHGLDGEFPGEEPVEAELLTARTMLVPEEVLGTGDAGTLLAANGMAPAAEERAVCSLPVQGIEPGSAVQVEVDFQHVILEDNEEDGRLTGEVKFILYKGNHYHLTVFTDWDEDIFVDTNDVWDDGDRVGITIAPQNIRIVQSLNKEGSAQ